MKLAGWLTIGLWILLTPADAIAIEGFSGSFWGIGIYDNLEQNPKTLGSLRQGVDWIKINGADLSTYGKFSYRFEDENSEFFNAYGPGLGISLKRGPYRVGWEYVWERRSGEDKTVLKSQFFLEWYFAWDLNRLGRK